MKKALITGITGQGGAYLAEFLLRKGYETHGVKRRAAHFNTDRSDHLYQAPHASARHFMLHYGDLSDSSNLIRIMQQVQTDDAVVAAGRQFPARNFANATAAEVGLKKSLPAASQCGMHQAGVYA